MPQEPFSSPMLGVLITLGNLAIWLGGLCAIGCVVAYWISMLRAARNPAVAGVPVDKVAPKKKGVGKAPEAAAPDQIDGAGLWGRRLFYATSGAFILAAVCLMTLILSQDYVVFYVNKNTNAHLPGGFRFAAFWSDQEGTFILWGLYNTVLGALLLWKAKPEERWVMPFFTLVNVSLFALLTFLNPFRLISPNDIREQLQGAPVSALAFLPTTWAQHVAWDMGWARYWPINDGQGLNESLQNFWMKIHPPTLFVGYSSMMVPAAFALGALMKRDYDTWVTRATPWLLFSWTVLGFGIFLGAYWAYETLGWGGYWSWDPVENSSIMPWIVGTALLHGLLAQRNRGNYKQANLFLGMTAGTAVLLGSFLVRSGVLSAASNHAFASEGAAIFWILLTIFILYFVMSLVIWFMRFKDIQSEIAYDTVWERHFGYFLGMIVLSATAAVIVFGVFFVPVLLPLVMKNKIAIDFKFYNQALIPVMFVTVVLMALTPLMPWRKARDENRPLKTLDKVILALCGLITVFFVVGAARAAMGGFRNHNPGEAFLTAPNDWAYLAFMLLIGVAMVPTVVCGWRSRRGGWLNTGSWVAHAGFLILLFGVVYTSRFNRVYPVQGLKIGETALDDSGKPILGRNFSFAGEQLAANPQDRDRILVDLKEGDRLVHRFSPKVFISLQNAMGNTTGWPEIIHDGLNDIYVSPDFVSAKPIDGIEHLEKEKPHVLSLADAGEPAKTATIVFHGLDMSEFQKAIRRELTGPPTIYANLSVTVDGQTHEVRCGRMITMKEGQPEFHPVHNAWIPGLNRMIVLADLALDPKNVKATFFTAVPQGNFQVLYIPGIQVLWMGCLLMTAGAAMSFRRRSLLARRPIVAPEAASTPAGPSSGSGARQPRKPSGMPAPEPAGAE